MIHYLDTSAVLNGALPLFIDSYISPLVVAELENIKTSNKNEQIKYLARQAVREILNKSSYYIPDMTIITKRKIKSIMRRYPFLNDTNDHRLLCEAILISRVENEPVKFVTSDGSLLLFARMIPELESIYFESKEEPKEIEYCGWGKYFPNMEQMATLYSNPENNILEAKINEFCEIYEGTELKDILFWTGKKYRPLQYKEFTSALGERIKPRNLEQKMYFDLLQNKNIPIKLCIAKFGTGKSWLTLSYALNELSRGQYDKIVFVKNNLEVKGAGKLGTLPGDEMEKQMPWLRQIEDHIGPQMFEELFESGRIEVAHLNTLRGRDLKNCIIFVDEAENLLITNIQLLLGRVSKNSEIIFCADVKQCDYPTKEMSGIPILIERLAGNPLFGMVKLLKTERSDVAATADLLD